MVASSTSRCRTSPNACSPASPDLARFHPCDAPAAYGARPVGALIGAVGGGLYGAPTCLVVAALGFLVQAVVIVASPVLRLARQPEMVG